MKVDLTVLAIPGFLGAMAAEWAWQRRHPAAPGEVRRGDYELKDTIASITMGLGSLAAPYVSKRLLDPLTPGVGRGAKVLIGGAVLASAGTTVLDVVRRRRAYGPLPEAGVVRDVDREGWTRRSGAAPAGRLTMSMSLAAVGATSLAAATTWSAMTSGATLFRRGGRDLGTGVGVAALAVLGWDAIYYWNHRLSHESRWLWAVHVVHHSSERYNLSTALRQPVAEGVTMAVPYGLLAWLGVRPVYIEQARALNLIYQFWIHTEVVRSIGWLEKVLNTPSHHRVHHGSNSRYLDRNHGSILILWDKLFGTFEAESEPVVYGLTSNIDSFNPVVIAGHEWRDMARDVAASQTWADRVGFVLRGPGWAAHRRRELSSAAAQSEPR